MCYLNLYIWTIMCRSETYLAITMTEGSLTDHWYWSIKVNTTIDGQVISAGELIFKAQYLWYKQDKNNWYLEKQPLQQTIIIPTHTLLHPRLDVITIRYVQDIPKNLCNSIKQKNLKKDILSLWTKTSYQYDLCWLWLYSGWYWELWKILVWKECEWQ